MLPIASSDCHTFQSLFSDRAFVNELMDIRRQYEGEGDESDSDIKEPLSPASPGRFRR